MLNLWQKFMHKFYQYGPSCVVCLSFLPSGLAFGYTLCFFIIDRDLSTNSLSKYGPLMLGASCGLLTALAMLAVKYLTGRIVFWQPLLLLMAGVFHVLGSCFYFADGFDQVGSFISYVAHSLTFVAGLSYLLVISSKDSRALMLAGCSSCYLLGLSTAISLIGNAYSENFQQSIKQLLVDFAIVYLCISCVVLTGLIGLQALNYLGTIDLVNSMDNELRISNTNGSIFDTRTEIMKRIQFFYVTKSEQWSVTLLLLFGGAVHYALFIYFVFWFTLNSAMRLTVLSHIDAMFWVIFAGSLVATISLCFCSAKVNFVTAQLCLILLAVLSMITCTSSPSTSLLSSTVSLWLILFFFGMSYASLQITLLEVSHLRFTECLVFAFYALQMLNTSIVYYYFVADAKNSYFYATDRSTLMAQGFVFIIITALLALVVGMKVPRTYHTPLMEIQYGVNGIIFKQHQIEQLNVRWLNDGTIPTIST